MVWDQGSNPTTNWKSPIPTNLVEYPYTICGFLKVLGVIKDSRLWSILHALLLKHYSHGSTPDFQFIVPDYPDHTLSVMPFLSATPLPVLNIVLSFMVAGFVLCFTLIGIFLSLLLDWGLFLLFRGSVLHQSALILCSSLVGLLDCVFFADYWSTLVVFPRCRVLWRTLKAELAK